MNKDDRIVPCLWFDGEAEAAAEHYLGIFPRSKIVRVTRYGEAGREIHGKPAGSVLTVVFELDGQTFTALNGGPQFTFNEALSLVVRCDTQAEIDHYWTKLSAGGDPRAQQCGWLKDKFGVSWQVVPRKLDEMLAHPDTHKSERVMHAIFGMKKLDIAALERA
jgi:predicted 3-demethylubiquinone-9 3-methyltransferase (glyoxalase superfamily)